MNVNFRCWLVGGRFTLDSNYQVAMDRTRVILALLLTGEIPMRVEPVRVARGEREFSCAIGFWQLRPTRSARGLGRNRSKNEFVTEIGNGGQAGHIILQQNWGDDQWRFCGLGRNADGVLRTRSFGLWTLDSGLWTLDFGLRTQDFKLRTEDFKLRTEDFKLRTEDFKLRTEDFGLRTLKFSPHFPRARFVRFRTQDSLAGRARGCSADCKLTEQVGAVQSGSYRPPGGSGGVAGGGARRHQGNTPLNESASDATVDTPKAPKNIIGP